MIAERKVAFSAMQNYDKNNEFDENELFPLTMKEASHTPQWFESNEMNGSRLGQLLRRNSSVDTRTPRQYKSISYSDVQFSSITLPTPTCDSAVQRPISAIAAFSSPGSSLRRPIIKMTNFPWEITKDDIIEFFDEFTMQESKIHIPIDRSTGKTKNEAFIELRDFADCERCIASFNRKILKGRPVSVQSSSYTELFNTHFPLAAPEQNLFLTREEINSILAICKNYKVSFALIFRCTFREGVHRDHLNIFVVSCIYFLGELLMLPPETQFLK